MNLHEYQGKELLAKYGVAIQKGIVAHSLEEAKAAYKKVGENSGSPVAIVKAQIHAGGRGKGGGVKLVKSESELEEKVLGNLCEKSLLLKIHTHQSLTNVKSSTCLS